MKLTSFQRRAKRRLTVATNWLNGHHALVTAVATALLAIATVLLAFISWNTDTTLRNTLVSANRAWVTPASAFLDSTPVIGKSFGYHVRYGNVGKEPAIDFAAQEDLEIIDAPAPQASLYTVLQKSRLKDVCARTNAAADGSVVYPSGLRDYIYTALTDQPITQDIQGGAKIIAAHGCFAYQTFQRERKSEYCFIFLNTVHGDLEGVDCPFGNTAD
jgi:hypothetical protein